MRLRDVRGRDLGDRVESPYDIDARFRAKSGTDGTGYMVQLTETCDPGLPRLVVHTGTTPANVHEAVRIGAIHEALSEARTRPSRSEPLSRLVRLRPYPGRVCRHVMMAQAKWSMAR